MSELDDSLPSQPEQARSGSAPRVALLTPYNGGNLGDAVIQDAVIANLRVRMPNAEVSGITLNCDNFLARHGVGAFPLLDIQSPFYELQRGKIEEWQSAGDADPRRASPSVLGKAVKSIPVLGPFSKAIYHLLRRIWQEVRHAIAGYRFLRTQDLLVVSGGGQLDEEWGGAWHHPYALFKWALLSRLAGVPYAIASVGACKAKSQAARFFLAQTLRLAQRRSYRDKNSREIAASLLPRAAADKIIPDLAFSLPAAECPPPASLRSRAKGRTIAAFSPIAYVKPGNWPSQDRSVYERYVREIANVLSTLLERDYFIVIVWSSLGDDESVIPEILDGLSPAAKEKVEQQVFIPKISSWQDLLAQLENVDLLIASRLHSLILSFIAETPAIAVSFDPKVDWLMEDLGLLDLKFGIRAFTATELLEAIGRLETGKNGFVGAIREYRKRANGEFASQYDQLAELALAADRLR